MQQKLYDMVAFIYCVVIWCQRPPEICFRGMQMQKNALSAASSTSSLLSMLLLKLSLQSPLLGDGNRDRLIEKTLALLALLAQKVVG